MSKLVAVQGCTIEYDLPDDSPGSVELVATVSTASSKVSSGNKTAYKDKITITVTSGSVNVSGPPSGGTNPGAVPPGTITIDGTSSKNTTEGDKYALEDDEGEATFRCLFTPTTGTSPVPGNVKIRAKVTDAGQNVLKVT